MVHELRASTDKSLARAEGREVALRGKRAMLDGVEQLWISARDARQLVRIDPIGLPVVLVDEPDLPGIGNEDLVAAVLQQSGHPRGLGTRFDRYARGRARVEPPAKCGGTRGEAAFFDDISLRVELAEMAVLVPEIDTDSHAVG